MIKKCEYCDTEYAAKRATSKYCSDKCRKLAFQGDTIMDAKNAKNGVTVPKVDENAQKNEVSVLKEDKMKNTLSVPENQVTELVDNTEVSVPERQLSVRYGDKAPKGLDDPYSPKYDLTEEGYIRRNKNWGDFSERFKKNIREGAVRIKKNTQLDIVHNKALRDKMEVNPLDGSKLAPKKG